VEYLIDLTPGQHGWAPRDLHSKWSFALPLEKDQARLEIGKFEPVSDYARRLFQQYREVRTFVMDHYAKASELRSKLANRFRKQIELKVGDRVVYRDPKARSEGRVPWKRAMSGPWVVKTIRGNKAELEETSGSGLAVPADSAGPTGKKPRLVWCHMEDMILCSEGTTDLESPEFDDKEMTKDEGEPLSIGQVAQSTGEDEKVTLHRKRTAICPTNQRARHLHDRSQEDLQHWQSVASERRGTDRDGAPLRCSHHSQDSLEADLQTIGR
jgi:hypothetical protein